MHQQLVAADKQVKQHREKPIQDRMTIPEQDEQQLIKPNEAANNKPIPHMCFLFFNGRREIFIYWVSKLLFGCFYIVIERLSWCEDQCYH